MGSPLADDLAAMVGVWHDHLEAFDRDGTPVTDDPHGGVPGPFPYDNLGYFDFDGATVTQTNVTFRQTQELTQRRPCVGCHIDQPHPTGAQAEGARGQLEIGLGDDTG